MKGDVVKAKVLALQALEGVGDKALGQWIESSRSKIVHVRRRISVDEESVIGPAIDIRGSKEESDRFWALFKDAPHLAGMFP